MIDVVDDKIKQKELANKSEISNLVKDLQNLEH